MAIQTITGGVGVFWSVIKGLLNGNFSELDTLKAPKASPTFTGTVTTPALVVSGDDVVVSTAQTPASAAATGTVGTICWDADYIYVCVATDTWKRVAIATWGA